LSYLQEERERVAQSETLAIRLSNIVNIVLFAAKVYASVRSGSLAIIASTLDSLLDLLSGFILWFTAFSMQTPNPYRYPIGKRRMQPLVSVMFLVHFYFLHLIPFELNDPRILTVHYFPQQSLCIVTFPNKPCTLLSPTSSVNLSLTFYNIEIHIPSNILVFVQTPQWTCIEH
jgi:hypothetical protein